MINEAAKSEPARPKGKQALPNVGASIPFSFIDLFSGIGGFRLGLEAAGGHCVFSSEIDRFARKTYESWFGEEPHGDLCSIEPNAIPDHDVLAGGFPCQPFSIAGVSKKNSLGREHGFRDKTQGTLFFHVAEVVSAKQPAVVFLENVKNLCSHDKGRTWQVIQSTLDELGYTVFSKVIDAARYVPQHRERVFIVGFRRDVFGETPEFEFPEPPRGRKPKFANILSDTVDQKYQLSDKLWNYLQDYAAKHRAKGNGFGFGIAPLDSVCRTLSARYYKDGSEILIEQNQGNPRRLTPQEAQRLMGFPTGLPIVVSDTQAYRQFGNAVVPPVIAAIAGQITQVFANHIRKKHGSLFTNEPAM
jgi:DNA (cytosine-5)-methyltransferase 1